MVLACLVVLPGCLTTALWESRSDIVSKTVLVGEDVERQSGNLELADTGIVFGSGDDVDIWATPLGPEGELAMALLADADYCEVLAAKLELVSVVCDEDVVEADSTLEIKVRLRANVPAETVPELDVEPAIHAWMVSHLMTQPVGLYRTAMVLEGVVGERRRRPGATKIQATYVKRLTRYQRVEVEEEPLSIWAKIALTPITLTLDIALSAFWAWLTNDSDGDDDHTAPRPTLSENPGESEQEWRARRHRIETGR